MMSVIKGWSSIRIPVHRWDKKQDFGTLALRREKFRFWEELGTFSTLRTPWSLGVKYGVQIVLPSPFQNSLISFLEAHLFSKQKLLEFLMGKDMVCKGIPTKFLSGDLASDSTQFINADGGRGKQGF